MPKGTTEFCCLQGNDRERVENNPVVRDKSQDHFSENKKSRFKLLNAIAKPSARHKAKLCKS